MSLLRVPNRDFVRQMLVVLHKETTDALRDRRSLMSALLFPLVGPLLIAGMFEMLARTQRSDEPLRVPVVGSERAPSLIRFLEQGGAEIIAPPADPEATVRSGEVDLVLVIPEGYADSFRKARQAEIEILLDSSRRASSSSVRRTTALLRNYSTRMATLRLIVRGVSPDLARPLKIEELDVATRKKRAARRVLDVLPMFFILAAFIASVNVAIDTTAGERERHSLEPLLVNPVSRRALALGKWLTTVLFSLVGVVATVAFSLVLLRFISLEDLGVQMSLGGREIGGILAAVAPMAFLAAAIQMLVATFARSFKEAQTYVTLLPFAAMIPAIYLQFNPIQTTPWMMTIPALAQQQLLLDALSGEIRGLFLALAGLAALIYALLAIFVTAHLLNRERIIFGR